MEWILIWGIIIAVCFLVLAVITSFVGIKIIKAFFKTVLKMFKEWD